MPVATRLIPVIPYAERAERLRAVLDRGASFDASVEDAARRIIEEVRRDGDAALAALTERFDGVRPAALRVPAEALDAALDATDPDLRAIIEEAAANVRRFHEQQRERSWFTEDGDGVVLGQRIVPMERVGLYVPGGTAAYPSSVLMNVIPAQVAGVDALHLVSPPRADGSADAGLPHPLVLATARLLGVEHVYAVGGAQAVAALAFGTDTIPRVDKIVGPGNAYVAAAKKLVYGTVDIDSIAGPSEIVVLADDTADARFVAADLLSQAEHDVRASAILVTPSAALAEAVQDAVEQLVPTLSRRAIIERALADYSACVVTGTMGEAVDFVNELAPEHLEIITADPWATMGGVCHAGAIFLGSASAEPVGDYFAGPNHVLPTGGTARYASALGVHDFVRRQSVIAYSESRLAEAGERIARFADAEGLDAHALAIRVRLDAE
ncbi:MAG: histidinol dehydrogenase [Rhodothermales bacterium]